MPGNAGFTKFRWLCTATGLLCSLADTASDILVGWQYFTEGRCPWSALTLSFIVLGSLCSHVFSYAWFKDDEEKRGNEELPYPRMSRAYLVLVHLLQVGFFTRHFQLLMVSFRSVWFLDAEPSMKFLSLAEDLSMLRLFETFLESVPQLILQLYIILQHQQASPIQYVSMVISFLNIAWTTVDYWRSLRRTLHRDIPSSFPWVIYLLYKVLTISVRILSLTLLLMLNIYSVVALVFVWLAGTTWAHVLKTDFCTSRCLEFLYRAVVGFILVFTFFNVKGGSTKVSMAVYYTFSTLQNLLAPVLLFLLRPGTLGMEFFLPVGSFILMANAMGLVCLVLYYAALHPKYTRGDEVDGLQPSPCEMSRTRLDRFMSL